MGTMKKHYHEKITQSPQRLTSHIQFSCPECQASNSQEVDVPALDFTAEKMSEMGNSDIMDIECTNCDQVFTCDVYVGHGYCSIEFQESLEQLIHADPPFYTQSEDWNDWGNYDLPDNPNGILQNTLASLEEIIAGNEMEDPTGIINRMIFTQTISTMEVYLCDTLIQQVMSSEETISKIINSDPALRELRFSLSDIYGNPDFVKQTIKSKLKNRLYHKIPQVSKWYKVMLDISIVSDNITFKNLEEAISFRHDCVHRNGRNKDEVPISVFTSEYLTKVIGIVSKMNSDIEKSISDKSPL